MRRILVVRRKGRLKIKSRSILQLQYMDKDKQYIKEYPIRDLDALLIVGSNLNIESGVLSVLSSFNIPVTVIAKDSVGIIYNPVIIANPHYRKLQYTISEVSRLEIALSYIEARIGGMKNILIYYKKGSPSIPNLPEYTSDSYDFEYTIRLWESQATNILWDSIIDLIKEPTLSELKNKYKFHGRKPRHSDPFNKTLSIMYSVLYSLATKSLLASGLDPTYGFLHRTRYSTPLTFDYTEQFKPIAIHATIDLINREGLPALAEDGELDRDSVNMAIKKLYDYLTLRHTKTGKTPYQYIFLKAICLAKYLEGKCTRKNLAITWDKRSYKRQIAR